MVNPAVDVKAIQALDQLAIEKIGIPSLVLMENAGRAVAQEIIKTIKRKKKPFVCIVCGLGHNAGDGFVVARHLMEARILTHTYIVGRSSPLKTDVAIHLHILNKLKYFVKDITSITKDFIFDVARAHIIVDAIFGVGLNREIQSPFKGVIEYLNKQKKYIVSVDIPSGLNGTSGKIYSVCIRATKTITFSFPKKGFFKNQGPGYVGKIVVADIGIPKNLIQKII